MNDERQNRRCGDKELQEHQLKEEIRLLGIEQNIKSLEEKITILSDSVSDLVSAWKAASWLISLIKWVGGIAISITAIVTLLKGIK